jgi:putrescine transport system ATP-binding protein
MATRIGVMENGRLAQTGTPAEVYERPASRFVAEFLGAANILPAIVRSDGVTLDLPQQKAVVRAAIPGQPGAALLALRPERLRLNGGNAPNRLSGIVSELAYGGGTLSCSVRLESGIALRIEQPLINGLASCKVTPGENVTVSWEPDASILLPP